MDISQLLNLKEITGNVALLITIAILIRQLHMQAIEYQKSLENIRGDFNTRLKEYFEFSERRLKEANETHERIMVLTAQNYTAISEKQIQSQEKLASLMTSKLDETIRIAELTQAVVQSQTLRQIQGDLKS